MSASDQIRAMLDQLMGTARNGPEASGSGLKFTDPKVCKSFLCACCPHEILASTTYDNDHVKLCTRWRLRHRMDLGECAKVHDYALRADYEAASKEKDYFYDVDACEHLKSFIDDCDRRTELAKKRLAETQEELSAEVSSKAEKVHELAESIGKKLALAEQVGAEGKVEESMKLMEEVEEIRKKKALAEQEYRNSMPASSYQQQKLRVCEVCSAYLGIHDNDRRLADHFGGKLHLGFIKIRDKLANMLANFEDRRAKKREARLRDPSLWEEPVAGGRGGFGGGRGDLSYRGRSRESFESSTSRSSYQRRSRSRSPRRERRRRSRSRSRDRKRRSKHRSRSRSRDRHSKKRSRSRDRKHRSHSNDHRRRYSKSPGDEVPPEERRGFSNGSDGAQQDEDSTMINVKRASEDYDY